MSARSPNQRLAPTQSDEFERRSRLISLVYEVLRDMKTPPDEATSMETFSDLSRAFSDKVKTVANLEAAASMVRGSKSRVSLSPKAK